MSQNSNYIIWGSKGHAKVLAEIILNNGGMVTAIFDNDKNASSCLKSVPLYVGEAEFKKWYLSQNIGLKAVVAIGGERGAERTIISNRLIKYGVNFPSVISPSAIVSRAVTIGQGCQILNGATIATDSEIEEHTIINNRVNIDHECKIGSGVHIAPGAILCGLVCVEDNAFVGAGSTILPRVTIGNSAIVGAGAVVTKDVPPFSIVVGNPARLVRYITKRDLDIGNDDAI